MQLAQLTKTAHLDAVDLNHASSDTTIRSRAVGSLQPIRSSGIAYALVFISGAAAMYAYHAAALQSQPIPSAVADQPIDGMPAVEMPAAEPSSRAALIPAAEPSRTDEPAAGDEATAEEPTAAVSGTLPSEELSAPTAPDQIASIAPTELRISGLTEPAPGKYAKLPLATSQAVAFVDVKLGDRVKKGWQCFSHWESPERLQAVKADLEKTKKLLEVSRTRATAATQTVERLKKLRQGMLSAQELQDAETNAAVRQGELEVAQLAVHQSESQFTAMEFEFNQAFVTSPIDGVVIAVDVIPGERRQLSGPFRGVTVMDARVLHCRCVLNQQQLTILQRFIQKTPLASADSSNTSEHLKKALDASVESDDRMWEATVKWIGLQADPGNGLIPVILEVQNPTEDLRSGIHVDVVLRPQGVSKS
jgi:biotin carboxyl carrier protein